MSHNKHNDYFQRKGLPNPMHQRIIAPNGAPTSIPVRVQHQVGPSAHPLSAVFPVPDGSVQVMAFGGMSKLETVSAQILAAIAGAPPVVIQSGLGPVLQAAESGEAVKQAVDLAQALLAECHRREHPAAPEVPTEEKPV